MFTALLTSLLFACEPCIDTTPPLAETSVARSEFAEVPTYPTEADRPYKRERLAPAQSGVSRVCPPEHFFGPRWWWTLRETAARCARLPAREPQDAPDNPSTCEGKSLANLGGVNRQHWKSPSSYGGGLFHFSALRSR